MAEQLSLIFDNDSFRKINNPGLIKSLHQWLTKQPAVQVNRLFVFSFLVEEKWYYSGETLMRQLLYEIEQWKKIVH